MSVTITSGTKKPALPKPLPAIQEESISGPAAPEARTLAGATPAVPSTQGASKKTPASAASSQAAGGAEALGSKRDAKQVKQVKQPHDEVLKGAALRGLGLVGFPSGLLPKVTGFAGPRLVDALELRREHMLEGVVYRTPPANDPGLFKADLKQLYVLLERHEHGGVASIPATPGSGDWDGPSAPRFPNGQDRLPGSPGFLPENLDQLLDRGQDWRGAGGEGAPGGRRAPNRPT